MKKIITLFFYFLMLTGCVKPVEDTDNSKSINIIVQNIDLVLDRLVSNKNYIDYNDDINYINDLINTYCLDNNLNYTDVLNIHIMKNLYKSYDKYCFKMSYLSKVCKDLVSINK